MNQLPCKHISQANPENISPGFVCEECVKTKSARVNLCTCAPAFPVARRIAVTLQ